jgi:hypothetical protein
MKNSCPYCFAEVPPAPEYTTCENCHLVLPSGWSTAKIFRLGLSGVTGSGKTVWIAAALKELSYYWNLQDATGEFPIAENDDNTKKMREEYQRRLYQLNEEPGEMLQQTEAHSQILLKSVENATWIPPTIWDIGFVDKQRHYLTIWDYAGETFNEDYVLPQNRLKPFEYVNAVIFVAATDILFSRSTDHETDAQLVQTGRGVTQYAIKMVVNFCAAHNVPLCVALTKIDTLNQLHDSSNASFLTLVKSNRSLAMHRAGTPGSYAKQTYGGWVKGNENDYHLVDAEVRSLLTKLGLGYFCQLVDSFLTSKDIRTTFCAVSSLGFDAEIVPGQPKTVSTKGLYPLRVLDPIMWAINTLLKQDPPQATNSSSQSSPQSPQTTTRLRRWFRKGQ